MTNHVYTLGYSGRTPAEIRQILEEKDAILFDIRFSPRSRNPQWAKSNLQAAVGADRYTHLKALGNKNYKGGPIEFVDFEAGLQAIAQSDKPVVLMCACKDPAHCHRTTAAHLLEGRGYMVKELGITSPKPTKPGYTQLLLL